MDPQTDGDSHYRGRVQQMDPSERLRERLAKHGPEYLSNAELLPIVLRTGIRHANANANAVDLAQALLTRFGGLTGLADAVTALTEVPGIGPAKATDIKSALEVGRRLLLARAGEKPRVTGASDAATILGPLIHNLDQETLRVMLLDSRHQVVEIANAATGSLNVVSARMRDLFRSAVRRNCAATAPPASWPTTIPVATPPHPPTTSASPKPPSRPANSSASKCSTTSSSAKPAMATSASTKSATSTSPSTDYIGDY